MARLIVFEIRESGRRGNISRNTLDSDIRAGRPVLNESARLVYIL